MNYYEVGLQSSKYHGLNTLTYSSATTVTIGTLVEVPLKDTLVLGVILEATKKSPRIRVKEIHTIHDSAVLPTKHLALLLWLRNYYPGPLSAHVQLFTPERVRAVEVDTTAPKQAKTKLPDLSEEQQAAISTLETQKTGPVILHGNTGTGKTRVYIEQAKNTFALGKSVLILTPEIGLAPQLVATFSEVFKSRIITLHSGLTRVQRDNAWAKILSSKTPLVVIGTRSALFVPLRNLGLVVVDESHDKSYKQDQTPYYEASRVAAKLSALHNCLCVYGSATPTIADYARLTGHGVPVIRMQKPLRKEIQEPTIEIINQRQREAFSKSSVFSDKMLGVIEANLLRKEQSLIFLNRRGTARLTVCKACGWQATCPNCDVPLTYHADKHQLQCHLCGFTTSPVTACPDCGSSDIAYQKHGTKSLFAELEKHFPQARILRFDSDNAVHEKLGDHYQAIVDGKVDIIVGTQVLAKGLDIPKLTLVCIPHADTSMFMPDYTADEQTYQLLRQVIGRVGRTSNRSAVILQTHKPDASILVHVARNDWQAFYDSEIIHREKFHFPPYRYLLQLTCVRKQQASAQKAAQKLAEQLSYSYPAIEILGPSPRFHEKIQNSYYWQLIIKATDRNTLLTIINELPSGWRYNIDPSDLL